VCRGCAAPRRACLLADAEWHMCAQHVDLRIEPLSSTGNLGVGRLQGLQSTVTNWLPFCPTGFVDSASSAACAAVGYEGGGLVGDLCAIAAPMRAA
jgi:hypothetical protein